MTIMTRMRISSTRRKAGLSKPGTPSSAAPGGQARKAAGPGRARTGRLRQAPPTERNDEAARQRRPTSIRKEFRAWRASLPAALERDTLLMPDVIAETVVEEAERFLKADLPANYAERLAARAHQPCLSSRQFHQGLNGPGNRGRDSLCMFMRHWTAAWLSRECNPLFKKPPWTFAWGRPLAQ